MENSNFIEPTINTRFGELLPGKPIYVVYMTCVRLFKDDSFRYVDSILFCTDNRSKALDYVKTHDNCACITTYIKNFDI